MERKKTWKLVLLALGERSSRGIEFRVEMEQAEVKLKIIIVCINDNLDMAMESVIRAQALSHLHLNDNYISF